MQGEVAGGKQPRGVFCWLWIIFFLHGMAPGFWVPALTNILAARGLNAWVALAFMVPPLCGLVSPLAVGALADQRVSANRLLVWTSLLASACLFGAFGALDHGWNTWWFIGLLGGFSLFSGPSWSLLATISLTNLSKGEQHFPIVRMGATVGWMAAGLIASLILHADTSPAAGYGSGFARLAGALLALLLPHTPPLGKAGSWKSQLGLDAFILLKHRDHGVFFLVTFLFSIPITCFYMYAPEMLKNLGDGHATATMTIAQITEVAAMLLVGAVMTKYRVKVILLWGLGLSVVRFGMSAYAGASGLIGWHIAGIALHGMCYTFYFITAQVFLDRRVDPGLRGQAQGLLALVSSGLGPLAGAKICAYLHDRLVIDGRGWEAFWTMISAMIAICFLIFAVFYRGLGKRPRLV